MERIRWLKEQRELYMIRLRKAAYPSPFNNAIRVYSDLIEKEEKK